MMITAHKKYHGNRLPLNVKRSIGIESLKEKATIVDISNRGNSEQFIWFLRQLHKASPDKKLIIILDNVSIHKSNSLYTATRRFYYYW